MKNPLFQLALMEAVGRVTHIYQLLRRQPLTETDAALTADKLSTAIRVIDPKRCRTFVVIAVQDPDPARAEPNQPITDQMQHTVIAVGHSEMLKAMLMHQLANLELASAEDPSGSGALRETVSELGLNPDDFQADCSHTVRTQ